MRKSRFTETQIVEIPKEGEAGIPVAEILRKHGISRTTHTNWRARYAGGRTAATAFSSAGPPVPGIPRGRAPGT